MFPNDWKTADSDGGEASVELPSSRQDGRMQLSVHSVTGSGVVSFAIKPAGSDEWQSPRPFIGCIDLGAGGGNRLCDLACTAIKATSDNPADTFTLTVGY